MLTKIIYLILSLILIVCSSLVTYFRTRSKKSENTDDSKASDKLSLLEYAKELIVSAESTYNLMNTLMKRDGGSAGEIKKKSVLSDLQAFALKNGITFDIDEWSKVIDEIITFTKSVNITK